MWKEQQWLEPTPRSPLNLYSQELCAPSRLLGHDMIDSLLSLVVQVPPASSGGGNGWRREDIVEVVLNGGDSGNGGIGGAGSSPGSGDNG